MFKNPDEVKRRRGQHLHIVGLDWEPTKPELQQESFLARLCQSSANRILRITHLKWTHARRQNMATSQHFVSQHCFWHVSSELYTWQEFDKHHHCRFVGQHFKHTDINPELRHQYHPPPPHLFAYFHRNNWVQPSTIIHCALSLGGMRPNVHNMMMQLSPSGVSIAITCLSLVRCRLQQHIRMQHSLLLLPLAKTQFQGCCCLPHSIDPCLFSVSTG